MRRKSLLLAIAIMSATITLALGMCSFAEDMTKQGKHKLNQIIAVDGKEYVVLNRIDANLDGNPGNEELVIAGNAKVLEGRYCYEEDEEQKKCDHEDCNMAVRIASDDQMRYKLGSKMSTVTTVPEEVGTMGWVVYLDDQAKGDVICLIYSDKGEQVFKYEYPVESVMFNPLNIKLAVGDFMNSGRDSVMTVVNAQSIGSYSIQDFPLGLISYSNGKYTNIINPHPRWSVKVTGKKNKNPKVSFTIKMGKFKKNLSYKGEERLESSGPYSSIVHGYDYISSTRVKGKTNLIYGISFDRMIKMSDALGYSEYFPDKFPKITYSYDKNGKATIKSIKLVKGLQ